MATTPTPKRPLVLDGKPFSIRSSSFGIWIETESWCQEAQRWIYGMEWINVRYALSIDVNEQSGEDGAPAPDADVIPVQAAFGGRHPTLDQLSRLTVAVPDEDQWEAWFGNDAPPLLGNRVEFLGRHGTSFRIRWSAWWKERGTQRPFLFEGTVPFKGIEMKVKALADADSMAAHALGYSLGDDWIRTVGKTIQHDDSFPAARPTWVPVTYTPR